MSGKVAAPTPLTPPSPLPYGPRPNQTEPHAVRFILIVSGAPSTDV